MQGSLSSMEDHARSAGVRTCRRAEQKPTRQFKGLPLSVIQTCNTAKVPSFPGLWAWQSIRPITPLINKCYPGTKSTYIYIYIYIFIFRGPEFQSFLFGPLRAGPNEVSRFRAQRSFQTKNLSKEFKQQTLVTCVWSFVWASSG